MLQILLGLRDSTLNNEFYHVVLPSSIQLHPFTVLAIIKLQGLILHNVFQIMVWKKGYLLFFHSWKMMYFLFMLLIGCCQVKLCCRDWSSNPGNTKIKEELPTESTRPGFLNQWYLVPPMDLDVVSSGTCRTPRHLSVPNRNWNK